MGSVVEKQAFLPPPPSHIKNEESMVWMTTKSGHKIPGLLFRAENAKITILFSHGNAEDLGGIEEWLEYLRDSLRVNVFGYDYSGYSFSRDKDGNPIASPSEKFAYEVL